MKEKKEKQKPEIITISEEKDEKDGKSAISILRDNNFKIRLVTPTSFGTQIDFAKKYEDDEIEEVLKDFSIKIKNKSVFIIE